MFRMRALIGERMGRGRGLGLSSYRVRQSLPPLDQVEQNANWEPRGAARPGPGASPSQIAFEFRTPTDRAVSAAMSIGAWIWFGYVLAFGRMIASLLHLASSIREFHRAITGRFARKAS
jgi:hypothetical protein